MVFPRMKLKVVLLALQGHTPTLPIPGAICTHSTTLQIGLNTADSATENLNNVYEQEHTSKKISVSFSPWFCCALEQSLHSLKLGSGTLHLSGFWNNPGEWSPMLIVLEARRKAGLLLFIAYYLSNVTCGLQRGCWNNSPIN